MCRGTGHHPRIRLAGYADEALYRPLPCLSLTERELNPLKSSAFHGALFHQLDCIMADSTQSYDELAVHYDQIFEDWGTSIVRQATVLGRILRREYVRDVPSGFWIVPAASELNRWGSR